MDEQRWRAHVAAASHLDYTFWVWQDEAGQWVATEVETGISGAPADEPREALDNYWNGVR